MPHIKNDLDIMHMHALCAVTHAKKKMDSGIFYSKNCYRYSCSQGSL